MTEIANVNTDTIIRNMHAILSLDALVAKLPNQMDTVAPADGAETPLMANASHLMADVLAISVVRLIHLVHAHAIHQRATIQQKSLVEPIAMMAVSANWAGQLLRMVVAHAILQEAGPHQGVSSSFPAVKGEHKKNQKEKKKKIKKCSE